ncbi:uncharacterized protein DMENIID0001_066720 [Sergentomyia squamirostris]
MEVQDDEELNEFCLQIQMPEAYKFLRDHDVNIENIGHLDKENIRQIFPKVGLQIKFQAAWEKYYQKSSSSSGSSAPPSRRLWFSVELQKILDCEEGRRLIVTYGNLNNEFLPAHRTRLVELIVDFLIINQKTTVKVAALLNDVAEQITTVFVNENKDHYYKEKYVTDPKGQKKKQYGGSLWARYFNSKRKPKGRKRTATDCMESDPSDGQPDQPQDLQAESSSHQAVSNLIEFLNSNECCQITPEIIKLWDESRDGREASMTLATLHDDWQILLLNDGYKLISADFNHIHPIHPNVAEVEEKWNFFFNNIPRFLNDNVKDNFCKKLLEKSLFQTYDDDRERMLLLVLHAVMKPTGYVVLKNASNSHKQTKLRTTIAAAQSSMISVAEKKTDIPTLLLKHTELLEKSGMTFQPVIFFAEDESEYVVYVTKHLKYAVQFVREAVDICFKSFHVHHLGEYRQEAKNVWLFIQVYIYGLQDTNEDMAGRMKEDREKVIKYLTDLETTQK